MTLQSRCSRKSELTSSENHLFSQRADLRRFPAPSGGFLATRKEPFYVPIYAAALPNRPATPDSDSRFDPHRESYDPMRRPFMLAVANLLEQRIARPRPPSPCNGRQRAPMRMAGMDGSTTKTVKFIPLPKKHAIKIFTRPALSNGRRGRKASRTAPRPQRIAGMHTLIFDFLNYVTGRLDPAIETIARKACISICQRQARPRQSQTMRRVALDTPRRRNPRRRKAASARNRTPTLTASCRRRNGSVSLTDARRTAADPIAWGATPPLPSVIEQAAEEIRHGARRTALAILETDPNDECAAALASFGRAMDDNAEKAVQINQMANPIAQIELEP